MAKTKIYDIKTELCVFLRNQDLISISNRGVTTSTEEFDGTGAQTDFTLSNSGVKNVRSVTVDGSPKAFGTDYTVNYVTGVVSFTVAPGSGTDNVDISYDYGTTDKIFPDFPQPYLKVSSTPRIAFDIISGTSTEYVLGAGQTLTTYTIQINGYTRKLSVLEDLLSDIRAAIIDNKKDFFYFDFITPTTMGPVIISPFGQNKILQRNQDCEIRFVFES